MSTVTTAKRQPIDVELWANACPVLWWLVMGSLAAEGSRSRPGATSYVPNLAWRLAERRLTRADDASVAAAG